MKFFILLHFIFFPIFLLAQDGGEIYIPDYTKGPEAFSPYMRSVDLSQHYELEQKLKAALETGDEVTASKIKAELDNLNVGNTSIIENRDDITPIIEAPDFANFNEWLNGDVRIFNSDIGFAGSEHKRIDMKMGEDGNLYVAIIGRPDSSYYGRVYVYKSTDGGMNWTFLGGMQSPTTYFGQVSLAVELRSTNNLDSMRVFLFVSSSTYSDLRGASITVCSFIQHSTGWFVGTVKSPTSTASKFLFPCAVTDGQYFSLGTFIGVTFGEYFNSMLLTKLYFARSTDWGQTFVISEINDSYFDYGDWYPVSAFKKSASGMDSIYIAVERRFSSQTTKPKIRILSTPWTPSSAYFRYQLSDVDSITYTKPEISILQDASSLPKKILVGCIKDGVAAYHYSTNGGASWMLNSSMGQPYETNTAFIHVSSDSNKTGDGYFIASYQLGDGDTIVVRRGIHGSLGTRVYKPNNFKSSKYNSPKVAIYRSGSTKYSALAYTGTLNDYPNSLYFDQENLTSISDHNLISDNFSLFQNYPNPFNPTTKIVWQSPVSGWQTLKVYDILGNEVATLVNEYKNAGRNEVEFDASKLSSGLYIYTLRSGNFISSKKMMLIK